VVLNEMVSRGGREELCGRWDGSDGWLLDVIGSGRTTAASVSVEGCHC
jgi:hypothetical protein